MVKAMRRFWPLVLVLIGLGYAGVVWQSAWKQSLTTDEIAHIPAGISYVVLHDFRMNPEHPPLLKSLAGITATAFGAGLPTMSPSWEKKDQYLFGYAFMAYNAPHLERVVAGARLPSAILGGALITLCGLWAFEAWGWVASLVTIAMLALVPELFHHARFVTTDEPLAAFGVATLYAAWRWLRAPSFARAVVVGLALGLALATKFSAGMFVAMIAVMLLLWRVAGLELPRGKQAVVGSLLAIGFAYAVLAVAYQRIWWPSEYLFGFGQVNANHDALHSAYLLGQMSFGRFWNYFIVAYLLKMPVPFLLGLLIGVVALFRPNDPDPAKLGWTLLIGVVVVFTAMSLLADDLGVRYVLPATPLAALLVGRGARAMGKRWWPVFAALIVWGGFDMGRAWPNPGGAFGEWVREPHIAWLDDSNVDWGEGLIALREGLKRRGIASVGYMGVYPYYPTDLYHVTTRPLKDLNVLGHLKPGYYALSPNAILNQPGLFWLAYVEPLARFGPLNLYRIGPDGDQQAMRIYQMMLREPPTSWKLMHFAAFSSAIPAAATATREALDLAIELWPDNLAALDARARLADRQGDATQAERDRARYAQTEARLLQRRRS